MSRNSRAWLALAGLALSGCISMTPASYMVSPDVKAALKPYEGAKVQVTEMMAPAGFNPMCRAVGNLKFENGLTMAEFVQKGFNDELRYAGVYGADTQLKGKLTRAEFSSTNSLVKGSWDLALVLESSNGKSMSVESRYDFDSGFSGITACDNTSKALAQATQGLVRKTVADPRFASLLH